MQELGPRLAAHLGDGEVVDGVLEGEVAVGGKGGARGGRRSGHADDESTTRGGEGKGRCCAARTQVRRRERLSASPRLHTEHTLTPSSEVASGGPLWLGSGLGLVYPAAGCRYPPVMGAESSTTTLPHERALVALTASAAHSPSSLVLLSSRRVPIQTAGSRAWPSAAPILMPMAEEAAVALNGGAESLGRIGASAASVDRWRRLDSSPASWATTAAAAARVVFPQRARRRPGRTRATARRGASRGRSLEPQLPDRRP